jgi:phosphonopyruvate decarboxylase
MMKRDQCLKILSNHYSNQIVVPAYQAAFEWMAINPSDLTYLTTGAMGQGSSHALGLALARPDKQVLIIDGDGSLLMNLGSLVTIASVAPRNLIHFVCENGTYEANGSHPIPGRETLDFVGIAQSAGYKHAMRFDQLDLFEQEIEGVLKLQGPVFVCLEVEQGEAYPQDYTQLHSAERRQNFKRALGQSI